MSGRAPMQIGCILAGVLAALSLAAPAVADPTPEQVEHFEKKIRPVLAEHCFKCHSSQAKKLKGELFLDSRAGLLKGGENGPAVVPGHPEKSRLIEALTYKNPDLQMPPKARLPESTVADLVDWVKMGAPWPTESGPTVGQNRAGFNLQERKRRHWCWRPLMPVQPPPVRDAAWPRDPSDQFLLAKLEEKGLRPAPPADRRTLLRRVYFDLVGLPPQNSEVEAFVKDSAADAFEKVVDRLLASPHFGERWGRHWLDLVRYAEARGHEFDYTLPDAYQYRDYVLRAFNAGVPYNQLLLEHLAGDLLPRPRLNPAEGFNESILGTGFWFLGEQLHSPVDTCQDRADRVDNMLDVMSKTFLGLTVACARCHDHKFDAISTKDYYALSGFLESSRYRLVRFDALEQNKRVAGQLAALRTRARPALGRALAQAVRPGLSETANYLLAARTTLLAGARSAGQVEQMARARKLDPTLLGRWTAHLAGAARDASNPLHLWMAPKDKLRALVEAARQRDAEAEVSLEGVEVVVGYARLGPEDWIQDGFAFGAGPVRPGDLRLGGTPDRPDIQMVDHAAAEKDPAWDRLRLAPGAEVEPGAPGNMIGCGRLLHTPTFRVTAGPVWYLVRGKGRAYAAVDGHLMIAGPLHAQLVQAIDGGAGFRWVRHDLSRYKGSLAHIEFTPAGASDFAVALVVQAGRPPGPVTRPNQALLRLFQGPDAGPALAVGYQRLLTNVAERLAVDKIAGSPEAADHARLAGWMLQHLDLFSVDDMAARRRLAQVVGPLVAEQARLTAQIRAQSRLAPAMLDANGVDEHVFIRGSYKTPGEPAPRRLLEALTGPEPLAVKTGSGRLKLARQMSDAKVTPLVPRVLVNRVWHHLFGRGLVPSVDNFGVLGEAPTHPELLDYLAGRFVKEGWSVKKLIRELVLSSAYRMSSQPDAKARQADPQDQLLYHMRVRRLEGEAIRDAMLTVSGRLDRRSYGPPVPVYLNAFQEGRGRPASGPLDGAGRRSVYLSVRRNFLPSFLLAFDTPIPFSTVGRRTVSNVPAQALILMNDPFVHQQAEVWARRVLAERRTARERVTGMYLSAFSRPPTADESSACLEFLEGRVQLSGGSNELGAWTALAHVLFNTKEFLFLN